MMELSLKSSTITGNQKSPESYRIKYAKDLQDRVSILPKDYDYILLGDFNSDYDEFKHLK